jgi:CheY-like chemotaxis protein
VAQHRPLRVLMVEDDVLVASVVAPALEAAGHTVVLCANADQALPRLESGQPFDVLFTDVVMPGALNGIDLVHWCEANLPTLPAVIATGFAPQHADFPGVVLRKPYAVDELLAALQQAAATPGASRDG